MTYQIRKIAATDNSKVAQIIRSVMTEFGAVGTGFSISDPEVDHMFEAYEQQGAAYYVVSLDGQLFGCGGFAQLAGGEKGVAELKKMYFLPALRGKGVGHQLINILEAAARESGFQQMYIETLKSMKAANHLYQKNGYLPLESAMGNTGHGGCDLFYIKDLKKG